MRRTEKYAAVTKDEAQRSPSALLRAMSLSNGRWTFYEAVKGRRTKCNGTIEIGVAGIEVAPRILER